MKGKVWFMEFFNQNKTKSLYEGELVMYDGIHDGKNVYTFLSGVVLVKANKKLYYNVYTDENYEVDDKKIEVGDIICRINKPLINIKNMNDVNDYVLKEESFFKDRLSIYNRIDYKRRAELEEKIKKDKSDLEGYNKIIKEQGEIVKTYAKQKF